MRSTGSRPGAAPTAGGVHTAPRAASWVNGTHPHRPQHLLLLLIVFYIKTKPLLLGPWMQTASTRTPTLRLGPCSLVSSDSAGWAPTCATGCAPLASRSSATPAARQPVM